MIHIIMMYFLIKKFKNIVCINVLNVVSKKIRIEIIQNIQELLEDDGISYFMCTTKYSY